MGGWRWFCGSSTVTITQLVRGRGDSHLDMRVRPLAPGYPEAPTPFGISVLGLGAPHPGAPSVPVGGSPPAEARSSRSCRQRESGWRPLTTKVKQSWSPGAHPRRPRADLPGRTPPPRPAPAQPRRASPGVASPSPGRTGHGPAGRELAAGPHLPPASMEDARGPRGRRRAPQPPGPRALMPPPRRPPWPGRRRRLERPSAASRHMAVGAGGDARGRGAGETEGGADGIKTVGRQLREKMENRGGGTLTG